MNVPLVCDYGSGFSKVGFSGMETPLAVFPTILGKLRHDDVSDGGSSFWGFSARGGRRAHSPVPSHGLAQSNLRAGRGPRAGELASRALGW